ncbi:hypothetical protein GOODEAATRI_000374 [Goodea atripinnis]|uniref:Uncharacterized protein n=1 Tax=Goodea atripinnis TaxID=208336 RepID=A0ABV0PUL3_9TELE
MHLTGAFYGFYSLSQGRNSKKGVKVRAGLQTGAHAARKRAHLVRTAAAFNLAPIALHAHDFLARKIQRRKSEGEKVREIDREKKIVQQGANDERWSLGLVEIRCCLRQRSAGSSPDHVFLAVNGDGRLSDP